MTVRPGVLVTSRATAPSRGTPTDIGTLFAAGLALRGPTDRARLVRNMDDFRRIYGGRQTFGILYDALEDYFAEGGGSAYVARVVGPAATQSTAAFTTAAAASISVDALGLGPSTFTAEVIAGTTNAANRILIIRDGTTELDRSPEATTNAELVDYFSRSDYVRVRSTGAALPDVAAPKNITGGVDDRAAITDTQRTAALALFLRSFGPGQVTFPGATTPAVHAGLSGHAAQNNRVPLFDLPDVAAEASLTGGVGSFRAVAPVGEQELGGFFAPWQIVPGVVRGTTRTVPASTAVAGLIARNDAAGLSPNAPSAGPENGVLRYSIGLSQPEFTDPARQRLNEAGVNVIRPLPGGPTVYGYRTAAPASSQWLALGAARTRMAVTAEADAIGQAFMFQQLDGKGLKIAEFGGALTGMLLDFYKKGALYGETAADAFRVDVGSQVNTAATLANNELRAVLSIRTSPFAEFVQIEIVKVPITELV